MIPRFRKGFKSVRAFEPRFSMRGPLRKDRLFLSQDFQYRYVNDPIKSLPGEPDIRLTSFDSFTRIDSTMSTRHSLGGLVVLFPRTIEHASLNTFRPARGHARVQSERHVAGAPGSLCAFVGRWCWKARLPGGGSKST